MRTGAATAGTPCSYDAVPAMGEALARWEGIGRVDTGNAADVAALASYTAQMSGAGLIDFGGMVGRAYRLLRTNPEVLAAVRARYGCVRVCMFAGGVV